MRPFFSASNVDDIDHREVPYFPTRRSSDLGYTLHGKPGVDAWLSATIVVEYEAARGVVLDDDRGREPRVKDRKSTRLHSSHSQTSYAVFCLNNKHRNRSSGKTQGDQ